MMRKFRRFCFPRKCYALGFLVYAASTIAALVLSRQPALRSVLQVLFFCSCIFFATGMCYELAPKVRNLWVTTIGKFALGFLAGFCAFVADLVGRDVIYKLIRENPDAFPSARTALIWIFTPLFWMLGLFVFAMAWGLVSIIAVCASRVWSYVRFLIQWIINAQPFRIMFGHRRLLKQFSKPSLEKALSRIAGPFGLAVVTASALNGYGVLLERAEPILEGVVVYTGFNAVPAGQYKTLQLPSFVSFLPGDRVCIAEPLPDGKFRFRTLSRNDLN